MTKSLNMQEKKALTISTSEKEAEETTSPGDQRWTYGTVARLNIDKWYRTMSCHREAAADPSFDK